MRLAYFVKPHLGGTYTLFRQLRDGLHPHGIDVEWMGLTSDGVAPLLSDMSHSGFLVHTESCDSERDQARVMMTALREHAFDGVFVNVLADKVQMNLVRYLPSDMLRMMIVHNITPGTYAAARSLRDHVHATVGVSERCRRDLVARHGFDAARTHAIPNAIEAGPHAPAARGGAAERPLRLIYLGRVEDSSKGVFWLADIMRTVTAPVTLTVAGAGPDVERLAKMLRPFGERVRLLGPIPPDKVNAVFAAHDVLVMPSRFEGFGLTILEAMAAGCIPLVSQISGVTDTIVENGISGLLFPVGDWRRAAREIDWMARDPDMVGALSANARERVLEDFGLPRMASAYARLVRTLERERPAVAPPLALRDWSLPAGMGPGMRRYVPAPVKNWLRVARERFSPRISAGSV